MKDIYGPSGDLKTPAWLEAAKKDGVKVVTIPPKLLKEDLSGCPRPPYVEVHFNEKIRIR